MMTGPHPNTLARTLRAFFADQLPGLRGLSPHTIRSYRDSLVLLLRFTAARRARAVARLDVDDLDVATVVAFLAHLEQARQNTAATRNVRLAAIHAFFRFLAAQHPPALAHAQQILGIPFKRTGVRPLAYLEAAELAAVLGAIDRSTRAGRRDYAVLATLVNTGARVQELLDLRVADLQLTPPYQVRLVGKGRKERTCPLWAQTAGLLRALCAEWHGEDRPTARVFLNQRGQPLTRFGVGFLLEKHRRHAVAACPSLAGKTLHPHSVRHGTAVHLLKAGVDLATIGQWLGHASLNTTTKYATLDLEMKRQALAQAEPLAPGPHVAPPWRKDLTILDWLEGL
jgi:site-specific recombinase XerD